MDIKDLTGIVKDFALIMRKEGLAKLELKYGDFSCLLSLSNDEQVNSVVQENTDAKIFPLKEQDCPNNEPKKGELIRAPVVGILSFQDSNLKVGQQVKEGQVIFLIESMKMIYQVKANRDGVVNNIFVENGMLVEYNHELIELC